MGGAHRGDAVALGVVPAVFQIAGRGALAAVEIDQRGLFAGKRQRNADMHGGGRFAGAALFIGEHDHMSSHDCPLFWLALRFRIAHSAASLSTPLAGAPW